MSTFDRKSYDMNRYYSRRTQFIELLGSKCIDCGSDKDLQFDHVDPSSKVFDVSRNMFRPIEVLLLELKKCVLRCKTCHRLKSNDESSVVHGEGLSGKKNCKCIPCRNRKSEYNRHYKQAMKIRKTP